MRALAWLALVTASACASARSGAAPSTATATATTTTTTTATPTPTPTPTTTPTPTPTPTPAPTPPSPAEAWRAAHRLIDLHTHVVPTPEAMAQAVRVMDAAGIGVAIDLSGGTVTHAKGQPSQFQETKRLLDEAFPGRFLVYMNLDYTHWDAPDFARQAVAQVEEGARLGAAGFKEFKRLGLYLRDGKGRLLRVDDPKLDPMWSALGRLGMPVSIHVADPKAFWGPYDSTNERWKELKDHPRWWFGDPKQYPPREDLLAALSRVVGRHPETTFVCVHFGNDAEDLDWVGAQLDAHPNMLIDIAARVPEFGRDDPERVRAFFLRYEDRILFATDFSVAPVQVAPAHTADATHSRMVLGSGGSGPPPTEAEAVDFFRGHWRYFETDDRDIPSMTPIQGDWTLHGIHLPVEVLEKLYFGNAERLLRAPLARLRGAHHSATGPGGEGSPQEFGPPGRDAR